MSLNVFSEIYYIDSLCNRDYCNYFVTLSYYGPLTVKTKKSNVCCIWKTYTCLTLWLWDPIYTNIYLLWSYLVFLSDAILLWFLWLYLFLKFLPCFHPFPISPTTLDLHAFCLLFSHHLHLQFFDWALLFQFRFCYPRPLLSWEAQNTTNSNKLYLCNKIKIVDLCKHLLNYLHLSPLIF